MKIACITSDHHESQKLYNKLSKKINFIKIHEEASIIIVIGGDGTLLHTIHRLMHLHIPFYGINSGTLGFLMNRGKEENLIERIRNAITTTLHPLVMKATNIKGKIFTSLAVNEVSIYRNTNHILRFTIKIDGKERIKIAADGALIATPAGSSAYNISAGGRIIPLGSQLLSLTPICPFRPRRWHGAILNCNSMVEFIIDNKSWGKVNAVADFNEFAHVNHVSIHQDKNNPIKLLFDNDHSLEERFIKEQFIY